MSLNGLSSLNASYITNISNKTPENIQVSNPGTQEKKDGNNKLKKAIIGLGIAGAAIALGAGVYYFSKGKNKGVPKISPASKPVPAPAQTPAATPKAASKPVSNPDSLISQAPSSVCASVSNVSKRFDVEKLGNGRIKATKISENAQHTPVELPEYLYHFTSQDSMDKIISSGTLKVSKNEQLKGLYLLDSKNFLSHYGNTNINGQNKDLLTAIFRQANQNNQGGLFLDQRLAVIKIPTEDLLQNGKLRIRTQEDFFSFTSILKDIENKTGKKFSLRGLQKDIKREELEKLVLSNGLMEKSEFDKFMRDMKIKIHHGYSLSGAASRNLENTHSIEYIFNHDIKLSDFPNIEIRKIKGLDYYTEGQVSPDKAKAIFEGTFTPLLQYKTK